MDMYKVYIIHVYIDRNNTVHTYWWDGHAMSIIYIYTHIYIHISIYLYFVFHFLLSYMVNHHSTTRESFGNLWNLESTAFWAKNIREYCEVQCLFFDDHFHSTPGVQHGSPEHKSLEKESPFGNHYFQVPC